MVLQAGDRRQRLRHATSAAHRRLDGLVDAAGLFDNRERYPVFLRATWAARRPAEQALDFSGVADLYQAWPQRRLCDTLSEDLLDVAHGRPAEPACAWPDTLCWAQSLGVLYVLEGSALGAHFLGKKAAAIGMTPFFGARHLAHQISQPLSWVTFIDLLTRTAMTSSDEDLCVAAALLTFERYQQAFEGLVPAP